MLCRLPAEITPIKNDPRTTKKAQNVCSENKETIGLLWLTIFPYFYPLLCVVLLTCCCVGAMFFSSRLTRPKPRMGRMHYFWFDASGI